VLVGHDARDVRAKALTHATAKWPWLATAAGPGRHVVRLSYGRAGDGRAGDGRAPDAATALADASTLLATPLTPDQLVAHAVVRWTHALPRPSAAHRAWVAAARAALADQPDVAVVGAWVAGNGLAAVIPDARAAVADFVIASEPDVVLFAVGAPQSELLCAEIAARGGARGVALCIGASLEFLTGAKRRAPRWMQRAGLEWLFRLLSEPRRLWRRYLVEGPRIFAIWWRWRAAAG